MRIVHLVSNYNNSNLHQEVSGTLWTTHMMCQSTHWPTHCLEVVRFSTLSTLFAICGVLSWCMPSSTVFGILHSLRSLIMLFSAIFCVLYMSTPHAHISTQLWHSHCPLMSLLPLNFINHAFYHFAHLWTALLVACYSLCTHILLPMSMVYPCIPGQMYWFSCVIYGTVVILQFSCVMVWMYCSRLRTSLLCFWFPSPHGGMSS